ncbi:centrosomal protein of 290 kDa isoform X1 [Nothoprocta perdicaria]|uniref:centrosomal protein of 290 kDa isoform X1 n=1 Tax=Nothoprocta perdicaria TaxID=30464 RepID=UPI000E1C1CBD|nr:centrosomal protein of 290 kDa isoform X1 [Nothoprocta perdicaria]
MAPLLDWKKLMKVDPDALPHQEELADRLLETVSKVDGKDLKNEAAEQLVHLFKIAQSLMKMKAQEVELALEEVEKAGEEQAKCENQFKTKVMKLENELEMALRSAGGRDTRFLRDEIHQLEKQLGQKERELTDMEKELEKEKKVNEQLALRTEDAENENIKLRRENEQLRQDVIDYQRQIDSQKETILSRRDDSDYRSQLSKKNFELVQYLDEIQNLTETNEKLDVQNQEMRKNLEESVQEMEKMTDEYNKMKLIVQQSDILMDQLRKEKEQYKFQVQELSDQLKAKNEEDDPLMAAVNAKVEEWKKILTSKDDELFEYQQMLFNLKEKVKMAELDVDRNNVMALQQGMKERDAQIRLLTEQIEQYTKEMEKNALIIEELKNELQKDKGPSSLAQQNRIGEMQEKLKLLEERAKEAEKSAELAEADAREKDKELIEALKRMRDYEMGIYGLEEAVAEIKDLKKQTKIRDHEIEILIKEVNKLELKVNDFLDENEELRERLGLEPKTMIDLNELRNSKTLKQQQFRAENQILLKEIERLEEERIELKKQIRSLAQEKGKIAATSGLDAGDTQINDTCAEERWTNKRKMDFLNTDNLAEIKAKASRSYDMERKNTFTDRGATVSLLKSEKDVSENSKALGHLSVRISGTLQNSDDLEEIRNTSLFRLGSESVTELQPVNDNSDSEALSIREIFISPELQFIQAPGIKDSTFNRETSKNVKSEYTGTFSASQRAGQTSETKNQKYGNTASFQNWISITSNSDQTSPGDVFVGISLNQKSGLFCESVLAKPEIQYKSQIMMWKDCSQVKLSDFQIDFQEDRGGEKWLTELLHVKTMENGLETAQSEHLGQVDPVENLIEQLKRELAFLRSQNEQISKDLLAKNILNRYTELKLERCRTQAVQNEYLTSELSERERDLEKNRTMIVKFQSKLKELSEENKQLEQGMKEILQALKEIQKDPSMKGGETALIIPSLDRLVNVIESKNAEGVFDVSVHLKAQVDQLTGRNEELRQELKQTRKEATDFSNQLANANEKITQLKNEICLLHQSEGANVVFKTVNLPEGMASSSVSIINSLNEYLIHLLQELESKEVLLKQFEETVEDYKRKFAVIRHQQGLLYKEYHSEKENWHKASEEMKAEKKKLEEQKEQDATKIKEYSNLLNALQMDPNETKKLLAENYRKITVLRVNERSLTRQCTTLLEMEQHLRKENEKLKGEITDIESTIAGKIGHLQRFKEMASFKIAALQKVLDGCVPLSELEVANKQYNALTAKYRDMLQKDNLLVQRTSNMEHMQRENESLKAQIDSLNNELEITKEKLHTAEQAWEQMTKLGDDSAADKATKAITNSEILSISKKITMLEMKELNERQRAEHSQRMYEHLRNTLKQVEERNFELETKFAELTKINLEAQKVEQELRDELSNSVNKAVSDADRRQIMDLEKSEMELKIEVSKLRELSDVAKMQVGALEARQQCREKEVESLRMQVLDYQAQSDEKAIIAKLHQHIIALEVSESNALDKLETLALKLQKMEVRNLRLEQKLDDREQALYFARLEGRNRAKHLRQTIQSLRRQFSGALPLAQQEKFSRTMIQLQNDKLKILEEVQHAQQERRNAENRALEMELKLKGLEELISALKDTRGAQKVIEWHMKMEELRLQELKLNRELVKQKEEMKYLNNIISEYECTISNLEEEIVQQNKFHEERQISWDQREVELQRQLDIYDHQQNEILTTVLKFEEAMESVPDSSLPLPQQLELALRKNQEHIRTILEIRSRCKSLEEKLEEKETALWKAEQNVLSRDKVINELRLQLPATSERDNIIAELGSKEDDLEYHHAIKIAHQTIANMQARLNQKEEVLKKYQHLLAKAREEQEEAVKKHEEDLRVLHQKLDLHTDNSLNKFKLTALELMKKPSLTLPSDKHFLRLAEMEKTVAAQDNSLASLVIKLKKTSSDLEKQKQITSMKVKEFESIRAQLQEEHAVDVEHLKDEANKLRNMLSQVEKELVNVKAELQSQKEANNRAPTTTMKNLVERLKSQLALKEKQQKALSKALLELRAEMTANAEHHIISAASQKEAYMNVQEIIDRQTKGLTTQIEELNDQVTKFRDNLKISKNKESSLLNEVDELNQELQRKQKAFTKVMREKNEMEKENEELQKRIRRLTSSIQNKTDEQNLIDELQKKVKKLENELEKKCEETEKKSVREDKTSKEEIIRWEEGKKWQIRLEGMRNKLKEKEKEMDALTKQFNTLKELHTKAEKDKIILQKKLKTTGVTVDRVVGARASETEKELEELRKQNLDLENEIAHMRTQQAIPRDSVVEELHFKNQYLQQKLHALQQQSSGETYSRHSTSGIGSNQYRRQQEVLKENLRLSSENVELRFQLEQANKDLPRLKDQVSDLKEMCELLKKEKAEVERKLGNVRGAGRSGKTVPELEKTIGLMKKVVERLQRENEDLKKAPGAVSNEKLRSLERENERLKSEVEKMKLYLEGHLSTRNESKAKGMEKAITENERLRKELKKEIDAGEKLRIAKNNLEVLNKKLTMQLEENIKRLNLQESRDPQVDGADNKKWKSLVATRMYETKVKELETAIAKKDQSITNLKQLLQEATEREHNADKYLQDLKEQIEILKHFPEGAATEEGLIQELQLLRLTNNQLENEKAELAHQVEIHKLRVDTNTTEGPAAGHNGILDKNKNDKLMTEVADLQTKLHASDLEKEQLKEEIKRLRKELDNFDPSFFEEIEDLKYNYSEEVKKNIILEERLKQLSEGLGIHVDIPANTSAD